MFLEILGLGAIGSPLVLAWSWSEQVSVATYVLVLLAFSAAIVTLLIGVIFATLPIQYFRHRRAFRDAVRRRGELSEEEREKAIQAAPAGASIFRVSRPPRYSLVGMVIGCFVRLAALTDCQ